MELYNLSVVELSEKLKNKELDADSLYKDLLKRIKSVEDKVKAFVRYNEKPCHLIKNKDNYPPNKGLYGLPVAIKDNICLKGKETTCASKILQGFKAPYDATVISKLKEAGASFIGQTNMDEFAFGSSCETSYYGPTSNPWDLERIPGGSSGGSAAAVAAGEALVALGSDTGGSIRQPAAMCGVVGLKPTYGRVSRYGLIAFASSLDQIGTLSKTVEDAALIMNIISGKDEFDSTSCEVETPDFLESLKGEIKGLKAGIPKEYFIEGLDDEVKSAVGEAVEVLKKLGVEIEQISLPHTKYAVSTYYLIAPAEASSNLARFDGVQYGIRDEASDLMEMYKNTRAKGFGQEAVRRIILGTYSLSSGYYEAYYLKALKARAIIANDFKEAFKKVDFIVTPTTPTTAFKINEKIDDPLQMYLSDIFTIPVNLAGIPAISIPCGFDSKKLPIGLQIITKGFDESTLFKVAYNYQQNTLWHKEKPKL
jgi:aspartyl-tRNA(Asn)/glutamyl-tRNA(Gln) amidotransferase subunit A